ncbi:MAG: AMP-binding protein [Pseudomonadota bacterium]
MSYEQLDQHSRDFAAYLQNVVKLPQGARVALMMPNLLQYPVCLFGALRGGYTVVSCNPLYTPRELEHQLKDSGAELIVIAENFAHTLMQVLPRVPIKHVVVTRIGDLLGFPKGAVVNFALKYLKRRVPCWSLPKQDGAQRQQVVYFSSLLAQGTKADFNKPEIRQNDLAFLQYTGGTTGVSKGVMLTHGNLLANVAQAVAWIQSTVSAGQAAAKQGELVVTALPLYHIFALTANCLTFVHLGARNLLITNPRDLAALIAELARYPFSVITGVNTLFKALLNNPAFTRLNFSTLKLTLGGGMAVHKQVADDWQRVTGKPLIEAYGLTEASPAVTVNPLTMPRYNGSIGLPISSTEVVIRDDAGHDLPLGSIGELCVRGPQVMRGYYQQPEESAALLMADGFLRTGDVAVMDEQGFVRLVDRKKDLILVSGFNVYPNEIESVIAAHPDVFEVAAIGVADERLGEAVKIFVVRRSGAQLSEERLMTYCRANLTAYKLPRHIVFCEDLPKNNVGKILRRALRDD